MRKFSMFKSAKAQTGEICTHSRYLAVSTAPSLLELCNDIANAPDKETRSELKKKLPVITWQAAFPGRRLNKEAEPSGLFMLDIDHVEDPWKMYSEKISRRCKELGILMVQKTASCHGLRIVAVCPAGLSTLADCQKWLAGNLKVDYDAPCKDWARCAYVVHDSYTYYMDGKGLWNENAAPGTIYKNEFAPADAGVEYNGDFEACMAMIEENAKEGESCVESVTSEEPTEEIGEEHPEKDKGDEKPTPETQRTDSTGESPIDQRAGLFGVPTEYKGIPYSEIAYEWLMYTGGEPEEGERNNRLYRLAMQLRYICDFNQLTLFNALPRYGLPEEEVKTLVKSACEARFGQTMPMELQEVLNKIDKRRKLQKDDDEEELPEIITSTEALPPLPPIFRQWAEVAPADFKAASVLANLPILGALGSRLRAEYLDGKMHSPSFMVALEAPQASGKSFVAMMVDYELREMMRHDEDQREKEKAYNDKVAEMKLLNIKVNADNKDEILGSRPKTVIRYLPPTISITKLFQRLDAAQGLHTFCYAPEVDTVRKANSRNFSNLSDLLRMGFDNDLAGQDYASENSYSGTVRIYYNCIYTGTPKAMRKFFPDVEDGLVSRILFVTLPDQFGKPMPVWGMFDENQKRIVDQSLTRLNEMTIRGDEIMPEYEIKLPWLNKAMQQWITAQQIEAVNQDDRTRDIFCRRAAVIGFRAGMLAFFLYDAKRTTPTIRKNVCKFAIWVANNVLNQHLLRFTVNGTGSNVNRWEDELRELKDEFTRLEAERVLRQHNIDTPVKNVLYKWKLAGLVETVEKGRGNQGMKTDVKFKKIKR